MNKELRWRSATRQYLKRTMSQGEFFAALFVIGCANGLFATIVKSVRDIGLSNAFLRAFDISSIVWIACFVGLSMVLRDNEGKLQTSDLLVGGLFILLVMLPFAQTSWLAVTGLAIYSIAISRGLSERRRGATILLAITVPMLWSHLVFNLFANRLLSLDAWVVSQILGTDNIGTLVRFADTSDFLAILPPCSSFRNISLAFLCWITISMLVRHQWSPRDVCWCTLASISVVIVNVSRLSLMALSPQNYGLIHGPIGDLVANAAMVGLASATSLLGVRRELFSGA